MNSDIVCHAADRDGDGYEDFLESIRATFAGQTGPLFTTDTPGLFLFDTFLATLPPEAQQHYTCHACRQFVEHYGGLVSISADGESRPAMWGNAPDFFRPAVETLLTRVFHAPITGVHVSAAPVWGTPVTGVWHHMAVTPTASRRFASLTQTAWQRMAELREDYVSLWAGIADFPLDLVRAALLLLRRDDLYRSEHCLGVAEWLFDLETKLASTQRSDTRSRLVWLAVATAPAGFCHVRSTMIGTLLDDLKTGLPHESVAARFAAKMHPLQYQRPQAPPSAGNVIQAEKVIEQLKAAGALRRRYAHLDEVRLVWKPATPDALPIHTTGVFASVKTKAASPPAGRSAASSMTMTWVKFRDTVLADACSIELFVGGLDNYGALVTAADPDAPPILQWDSLENRNPVSHYIYAGGSLPASWGLETNKFCPVTGICLQPSMWQPGFDHQGRGAFILLDGARDQRHAACGSALFPEILRNEFHGIRATLEAYSQITPLEGYEESSACGLKLEAGGNWDVLLRVTNSLGISDYRLDRWE